MYSMMTSLAKWGKPFWAIAGFIQIILLGLVDYLTGYEISISLFYLIPLMEIAWFVGSRAGIWVSAVSTLVWLVGDIAAGQVYSHSFVYGWNAVMRLGLFVCPILLLTALKKALLLKQALSRTDQTTGAANSHCFWDLGQMEIERSSRYKRPLTFAYLDLDNCKIVNRRLGYSEDDMVLRSVVSICKKCLRKTDVVARLGGDGFAFLLPETPQEGAEIAISTLHLALVEAMQQNNWPVTFTIGVLNCASIPQTVDEAIEIVDSLIDSAKRGDKNAICYATYIG
jgi:diguanylate cyclase (GGDEF)-like protein